MLLLLFSNVVFDHHELDMKDIMQLITYLKGDNI